MDVQGRTILVLGGAGLVGKAVCRHLLAESPGHLVVASIDQSTAEAAAAAIRREAPSETRVSACWGNIFVRWEYKDLGWDDILADPEVRRHVLADLLDTMEGERKRDILTHSTLNRFVEMFQPDGIVDCINTATAFAYQNIYASARELLAVADTADPEIYRDAVERHLTKMYIPHVVRHIQILYEIFAAEREARWPGVRVYVKIGTSGTGGMGLNIPYTHGEEKPSSVLLSKTAVAGAHSMLLFLLARTPPGYPAVKEVKPTAAIGWSEIGYGPVRRRGRPIPLFDCPPDQAYPLAEALAPSQNFGVPVPGKTLENVYIDTGENGLFALGEFTSITTLNQMEFVTPEEIAEYVVLEMKGGNTGFDVISAIDQAVLGPTYRAGILRQGAITRMRRLEAAHNARSVAFELLGPPRLSKLLFEAYLLQRATGDDIARLLIMPPEILSAVCHADVCSDANLRMQMISIGIPILKPDGQHLLRGPQLKAEDADSGWVDLRPANMVHWQQRLRQIREMTQAELELDAGQYSSRYYRIFVDPTTGDVRNSFDIGEIAGWIFNYEEHGSRLKS